VQFTTGERHVCFIQGIQNIFSFHLACYSVGFACAFAGKVAELVGVSTDHSQLCNVEVENALAVPALRMCLHALHSNRFMKLHT
jgi:thiamine transporter ThiT